MTQEETKQEISICYTNYRGETTIRKIIPQKIWFGKTDWHPEDQWLLDAIDTEKNAERSFAIKDIKAWF
jgi:predicted DNA-binding transcriptional regulator YafY